jgi:Thiolase C-terminal domain-like
MVSVAQREWAAKNPRATFKTPITVDDVLNLRMIAYPFRLLQCCLVTDGGGLSYMHSGMYGMYALQESVRQMRGIAPAQIPGAKISVCHGVGGMQSSQGPRRRPRQPYPRRRRRQLRPPPALAQQAFARPLPGAAIDPALASDTGKSRPKPSLTLLHG